MHPNAQTRLALLQTLYAARRAKPADGWLTAHDLSLAMKAIADLLESRTAENFANQSGPLGKWPALKNAPRNKRRTRPQILVDTARLKSSITSRFDPTSAEVGTNVNAAHRLCD